MPLSFYKADGCTLAKACLGKLLVCRTAEGLLAGIISETEAYMGVTDRASHAYGGRRTERNRAMYLDAGFAYVYRIYGLYSCLNITAACPDNPEAVLVRSVIPLWGVERMNQNRQQHGRGKSYPATEAMSEKEICRMTEGPGRLCTAFGIDIRWNGLDLTPDRGETDPGFPKERFLAGSLYLADAGLSAGEITACPRVGIDYAGEDRDKPWRFLLAGPDRDAALRWAKENGQIS